MIGAFDRERARLTIAEVAQRTGLTGAAARRYLITLGQLGYMGDENKLFSLTPMVLRPGQSYLHSARLARIVQPLLYRLAYSLEEAASAGVLDNDDLGAWRPSAQGAWCRRRCSRARGCRPTAPRMAACCSRCRLN